MYSSFFPTDARTNVLPEIKRAWECSVAKDSEGLQQHTFALNDLGRYERSCK